MGRNKNKLTAAWLGAGAIVLAPLIAGLFTLFTQGGIPNIFNKKGQVVIGDGNTVTVNMSEPKKRAQIDLLKDVDMHLGDNIYPGDFGLSYNPLTQDIYPQNIDGLIFFDKQENVFLTDKRSRTQIGVYLAKALREKISQFDYSAYQFVFAVENDDPEYQQIVAPYLGSDRMVDIGRMTLLAVDEEHGNFYRRYAAVGFAKSFSLLSAMSNVGIDPLSDRVEVKVILNTYHGGIRPGQSENFVLKVNDYEAIVSSKTPSMRDPQEVVIDIPVSALKLDRSNYLFLYVLPWEEELPVYTKGEKPVKPVHFRDVGVISLQVAVEEV